PRRGRERASDLVLLHGDRLDRQSLPDRLLYHLIVAPRRLLDVDHAAVAFEGDAELWDQVRAFVVAPVAVHEELMPHRGDGPGRDDGEVRVLSPGPRERDGGE